MRQEDIWDADAAERYDTPGTGMFAPEVLGSAVDRLAGLAHGGGRLHQLGVDAARLPPRSATRAAAGAVSRIAGISSASFSAARRGQGLHVPGGRVGLAGTSQHETSGHAEGMPGATASSSRRHRAGASDAMTGRAVTVPAASKCSDLGWPATVCGPPRTIGFPRLHRRWPGQGAIH